MTDAINNVADLASHHIEGYAHAALAQGQDGHFDVPLISHVRDGLWQGGCIDGVRLPDDFDFVLSLYPWERYALGTGTVRIEVEMYDSPDQGFEQVDALADGVVARLADGEKVLVHCQAGLNRSGLLAATVLIKQGLSPADAINLLRGQRSPVVLCNLAFEQWLRSDPFNNETAPGADTPEAV